MSSTGKASCASSTSTQLPPSCFRPSPPFLSWSVLHPILLFLPCSSLLWHLTTVVILGYCRAFPMYCEFLRLGNLFVFTMVIHQQHAWYIVGTQMFTEWLKEGLPLYPFLFQSSVNLRKQTLFSVQHSSAFQQRQYRVTAGCAVAIVFVYLGHTRIIHYWFLMSCDMRCLRKVAYKNQIFSILLQHSILCKKIINNPLWRPLSLKVIWQTMIL